MNNRFCRCCFSDRSADDMMCGWTARSPPAVSSPSALGRGVWAVHCSPLGPPPQPCTARGGQGHSDCPGPSGASGLGPPPMGQLPRGTCRTRGRLG